MEEDWRTRGLSGEVQWPIEGGGGGRAALLML